MVGMEMIIAGSVTPRSTPRGQLGSLRRRDDNSRSKVQNVRKDSSALRFCQRIRFNGYRAVQRPVARSIFSGMASPIRTHQSSRSDPLKARNTGELKSEARTPGRVL
jgi:hypothetical protein